MAGLGDVDALAQIYLAGKRLGLEVRLTPTDELHRLLELCGLAEMLGKLEQRGRAFDVEEEGEPRYASA